MFSALVIMAKVTVLVVEVGLRSATSLLDSDAST